MGLSTPSTKKAGIMRYFGEKGGKILFDMITLRFSLNYGSG